MENKIVVITGSSAGIGKETAFGLLKQGATVIFACRDQKKTLAVLEETKALSCNIKSQNLPSCFERSIYMNLELKSFKSVRSFVKLFTSKYSQLDILINNAGYLANSFELTEDKLEAMVQTNHYSHVLLTNLLLEKLNKKEAKIINVASDAHRFSNYSKRLVSSFPITGDQFKAEVQGPIIKNMVAYGNTKLCNIYFSQYLADTLNKNGYANVKSFSLHPGVVNSEFTRFFNDVWYLKIILFLGYPIMWYVMKDNNDGAQTTLHLCYEKQENLIDGAFYQDCALGKITKEAKSEEMRKFVMEETLKVVNETK